MRAQGDLLRDPPDGLRKLTSVSVDENSSPYETGRDDPPQQLRKGGSGEHTVPREVCQLTKITRSPCRMPHKQLHAAQTSLVTWLPPTTRSSTKRTSRAKILSVVFVVQDLSVRWIQSYRAKKRTSQETMRSSRKFLDPHGSPKVEMENADSSLEFGKSFEEVSWNHGTSTLHRSETNGIAERAVRRIKEGTSDVLLQSGHNEKWWAGSTACYCHLRNVQDLLSDGKTPYARRFGGNQSVGR